MTKSKAISASAQNPSKRHFLLAAGGFFLLVILMFGDVVFSSGSSVLSTPGTDTHGQFLSWRKFGFEELRKGNLPLWNPYVFCGAPYFGGFQSALLYPLNAIFLFLPVTTAINWSIALHVFLAGFFVYVWLSSRKLHPAACFLAGVIWMFSGPYFLHVYEGHIPNLCTLVWSPLVFLTFDRAISKPDIGCVLLGTAILSMQILAGHPQYVFYTSFLAGVYLLLRISDAEKKWKTLVCIFAVYVGSVALTAIQLLAGIEAGGESMRGAGLSTAFVSTFSFPQENLITLIAPGFYGNMKDVMYWGRWGLWETCLFCSVTGFIFAAYGLIGGYNRERSVLALIILLSCLLALGSNTKLFDLFYNYVPGFNKFRGWTKFISLTSLLIALFAAMGLDDLIRRRRPSRRFILGSLTIVLVLMTGAIGIRKSSENPIGLWHDFIKSIAATEKTAFAMGMFDKPEFIRSTGLNASHSLLMATAIALCFLVLLILHKRLPRLPWLFVLLASGEMFAFARTYDDSFDAEKEFSALGKILASIPASDRVHLKERPNLPMYFERGDIWGNDPSTPARYAQFIAFTQRIEHGFEAEFDVVKLAPFFRALRCRYVVVSDGDGGKVRLAEVPDSMPQLSLINHHRVISSKKDIFLTINNSRFDPSKEVVLEKEPLIKPDAMGDPGNVKLINSSTDFLEIEADTPSATILLITDSYTPGWHAIPLPGSSQPNYELLPADYCLRAVPLAAGHHRIRVEYVSRGFLVGRWISLVSLAAYLIVLIWNYNRGSRKSISSQQPI